MDMWPKSSNKKPDVPLICNNGSGQANIFQNPSSLISNANKAPKQSLPIKFIRIWVMLILASGYALNAASICLAVSKKSQLDQWTIVYIVSCIVLCILCLILIMVILADITKRLYLVITLFVITICGQIISVYYCDGNKYVWWQFELLYILKSSYFMILICVLNKKYNKFTQGINVSLLSMILFVSPFITLLNVHPSKQQYLFSSYLSICIATSILVIFHVICLFNYYKSGLFLKLLIIACVIYYFVFQIKERVNFDKYDGKYRIYCYYISYIALSLLYIAELFVKGPRNIKQRDVLDLVAYMNPKLQNESRNKHMMELEASDYDHNPNEKIRSVVKIFPDFKPVKEHRKTYFKQLKTGIDQQDSYRFEGSIAAIVPFYNEKAYQIHATLKSLYDNFEYIKKKDSKYQWTHFNVLLIGDGWFKADISTKQYLARLYTGQCMKFKPQNNEHHTVILQTENNQPLCINPFHNNEKKMYLQITTVIKIDNRKKANSHEWFLGKYGFAEWCKCDYMFFTDAYSTLNEEGLYRMVKHMEQKKNKDVVCCTGRARVYTIEQELQFKNLIRERYDNQDDKDDDEHDDKSDDEIKEEEDPDQEYHEWWKNIIFQAEKKKKKKEQPKQEDEQKLIDIMAEDDNGDEAFYNIQNIESDHRLSMNAHLRACQMFEFEALYGTIGSYLLGSFLPVIPGPCGFYRSKYLLKDICRCWYFDITNTKNDPNNMDLVLGNMKLAEDRILTISSILNCNEPVRHTLIPGCIFYFDPMPSLPQLMKQRRRWINGSIATVIFVLRKISSSQWKVNCLRKYYVLIMWYMQLFMYLAVAVLPPLLFTIAFIYGLGNILAAIIPDDELDPAAKYRKIDAWRYTLLVFTWLIYLLFIYYVQGGGKTRLDKYIKKKTIVQFQLILSSIFGIFTIIGTVISFVNVVRKRQDILSPETWEDSFKYIVVLIQCIFFLQSFVLSPILSRDIKTLFILCKTFFLYFLYAPFYVTFFFINAIANIHDLSWGTRPDNDESTNNPKSNTIKVLIVVIIMNIIIGIIILPITNNPYGYIVFFSIFALPSIYQIFFSIVWLIKERLISDLLYVCCPRKFKDGYQYNKIQR